MNCCSAPNGLDKMFDQATARSEAARYLRQGIDPRTRLLANAVRAQGIAGASVLEIGSGIGGLHLELLKSGAARATSVDLSAAYVAAAKDVAVKSGLGDAVDHQLLDFAQQADQVAAADVVVMHRVVCCYPDMPALVRPAARHARRILALSFPRDVWWMRLGGGLLNAAMRLRRNAFRLYLHPPAEILATVRTAGLTLTFEKLTGAWHIVVFRRDAV